MLINFKLLHLIAIVSALSMMTVSKRSMLISIVIVLLVSIDMIEITNATRIIQDRSLMVPNIPLFIPQFPHAGGGARGHGHGRRCKLGHCKPHGASNPLQVGLNIKHEIIRDIKARIFNRHNKARPIG